MASPAPGAASGGSGGGGGNKVAGRIERLLNELELSDSGGLDAALAQAPPGSAELDELLNTLKDMAHGEGSAGGAGPSAPAAPGAHVVRRPPPSSDDASSVLSDTDTDAADQEVRCCLMPRHTSFCLRPATPAIRAPRTLRALRRRRCSPPVRRALKRGRRRRRVRRAAARRRRGRARGVPGEKGAAAHGRQQGAHAGAGADGQVQGRADTRAAGQPRQREPTTSLLAAGTSLCQATQQPCGRESTVHVSPVRLHLREEAGRVHVRVVRARRAGGQVVRDLGERQRDVEASAPLVQLRAADLREQLRDLRVSDARYAELKGLAPDNLHALDHVKVSHTGAPPPCLRSRGLPWDLPWGLPWRGLPWDLRHGGGGAYCCCARWPPRLPQGRWGHAHGGVRVLLSLCSPPCWLCSLATEGRSGGGGGASVASEAAPGLPLRTLCGHLAAVCATGCGPC